MILFSIYIVSAIWCRWAMEKSKALDKVPEAAFLRSIYAEETILNVAALVPVINTLIALECTAKIIKHL